MNIKVHKRVCLGGLLLLILLLPIPSAAQEASTGFQVLVSPIPCDLAGRPMEISFNGFKGRRGSRNREAHREIRNVPAPVFFQGAELRLSDDFSPSGSRGGRLKPIRFGAAESGQEAGSSQPIFLEVKAGLLGGALFVVLPL